MNNTKYLTEFSEEEQARFAQMSLAELVFSARAVGILNNYHLQFVGELASMTERELLNLRNCGRRSCNEFKSQLATLGLRLAAPKVKTTVCKTNNTYLVLWHQRHGVDHFLVRSVKPPTIKEIVKRLELPLDLHFNERIEISQVNKTIDLDKL